MRTSASTAVMLLLAGCAAVPQQTITRLDVHDPKFASPACIDIRGRALGYDDRVGERVVVGVISGLVLGPFGLPIAAAVDAKQDEERRIFNREITLRCITGGEAIVAAQDAERARVLADAQINRDRANPATR